MKDFFLWKGAHDLAYASSIASTWIWAPAIFVASSKAYYDGLWGFLMFLIPNILTLVFFAYFAKMVREKTEGFTLVQAIESAGKNQKRLHLAVSLTVLICSTCVQFLGLHLILSQWIVNSELVSAIVVSTMALLMVGTSGIKGSIQTDVVKYVVMFVCGVLLLFNTDGSTINLAGHSGKSVGELWKTFGVATTIGLLSAPYVDQTFWQRVFSIDKEKVFKTFIMSAMLFGLIPLIFGLIGFYSGVGEIQVLFGNGILSGVLALCVLCALLSTLDSNLCAISSIVCKEFGGSLAIGKLSMVALLLASSFLMILTDITIVELFLIYGTIRTCVALPTILIILDKYDKQRLFYATLATVLIAPIGYLLGGEYNYLFTIMALCLPILGFKNETQQIELCKTGKKNW